MKNLRFRVWDDLRQEMSQEVTIHPDGSVTAVFGGEEVKFPPGTEVMISTGYRDRNGVEVFEGDIVKEYYWCTPALFEVRFDEEDGTLYMQNLDDHEMYPLSGIDWQVSDVVGHRYQPEQEA